MSKNALWVGSYSDLVDEICDESLIRYQRVSNICQFDRRYENSVIIVDYLNPELFILFSSIRFIIANKGSVLSHLSILAREYRLPIIRSSFPSTIPEIGFLTVHAKDKKIAFYSA